MTTQGFTGASYLEITFLDPKDNPPERVTWNTQYLYLPSAPSTYTRLTDAISDVLSSLKKVQYEKVFNNIDALAITAKRAIDDSDFPTVGKKLNSALDNLEKTSSSYKSMADELSKIIKSGEIENTLTNINKASSRISSITEQADTTLEELATTVSHTNEMISGYREQISTILDNTESTTSNLKSFTNNAKEYPSQMIWGSPPPALNPKSIN